MASKGTNPKYIGGETYVVTFTRRKRNKTVDHVMAKPSWDEADALYKQLLKDPDVLSPAISIPVKSKVFHLPSDYGRRLPAFGQL